MRLGRAYAAIVLGGATLVCAAPAAGDSDRPAEPADAASVAVLQTIDDLGLALDGQRLLDGEPAGTLSGPDPVPAGPSTLVVTDGVTSAAVPLDLPGRSTSTLVTHLDASSAPAVTAFTDDLSGIPIGYGRVIIRDVSGLGHLQVRLDRSLAGSGPLPPGTEYLVPAGPVQILAMADGSDSGALTTLAHLDVESGALHNVYLWGDSPESPSELRIATQVLQPDAAGPSMTAEGPPGTDPRAVPIGIGVLGALTISVFAYTRSRRTS